jgi:hypothetical protein
MWLQYYFNVIILLITVCNLIPDIFSYLTLEYTEYLYNSFNICIYTYLSANQKSYQRDCESSYVYKLIGENLCSDKRVIFVF